MARHLLDTDAIIDYLVGVPASVALIQELFQRGDLLCVGAVGIAEVYAGLRPADHEKAQALLASLTFLPTSAAAAQQAGAWRYHYARQGMALSTTDTLVAATAYEHQASVVTGNLSDYPMSEITVLPLPRLRGG